MGNTTPNLRQTFDIYTPLDYKGVIANGDVIGDDYLAPMWVGAHRRRLQAYKLLLSYRDNAARLHLSTTTPAELAAQRARREYGDGNVIIETVRAAVMGDSQEITVAGADAYSSAEDSVNDDETVRAFEAQELLRDWSRQERLKLKMVEAERNACSLGDGVYTLWWSEKHKRPRARVYDPGFYFPVLSPDNDGDYPRKVHIAWELTKDAARELGYTDADIVVHRATYELRAVEPYAVPWSDTPATEACFFTDAEFVLREKHRSPDDLGNATARYLLAEDGTELRDVNLGIDFIPVVHIPNTVAEEEHFGRSVLLHQTQTLDDLHEADTDKHASARLTGNPMLAIEDGGIGDSDVAVEPGKSFRGKGEFLSGAEGLAAMADHIDRLLARLLRNTRIPEAQFGAVNAADVASGVALFMTFAPMRTLIEEMRDVREEKYGLLLKFVQRYYMRDGQLTAVEHARVNFGSYLPTDVDTEVNRVINLHKAKLMSTHRALTKLQELGVGCDDVPVEVQAIQHEDFEGAKALDEALLNEEETARYLGREVAKQTITTETSINRGQEPGNTPDVGA